MAVSHQRPVPPQMEVLWSVVCILLCTTVLVRGEYLQNFEISESVPVGTVVGFIGQDTPGAPSPPPPPYIIVPVPNIETDLAIDVQTGEIRNKVSFDRERRSQYSVVAIPRKGENVRVVIKIRDENDNAPEFSSHFMAIEFPENTHRDMKRTLYPAKDRDLGLFNTQRYHIVSGNVNNAFRLSSHRGRDDVLYLDLQINGYLDRETTPFYSLVIEAFDGGTPPLKGSMTVNITIQDVNDNQPIFNQSRYFATIAENATIGTSVLRVFATDTDAAENGKVTYSINRRQSDRDNFFSIDPVTGVISVNKPLDFESKDVHELVVVARDNGAQPLETTAFVSIRITDVNDNQPTINLIFLSDDASPKITEDARKGEFVARISVNDPDSKEEYANVNVTLHGGDGRFGLTTQDNIIYLVIVSTPLDRETKSNYTMIVTATDQGNPPLNTSRNFELTVTDVNDNAPEFDKPVYYANVLEVADPGTSVFQLSAKDRDQGDNAVIQYNIETPSDGKEQWFAIDSFSGLITTKTQIDCEDNPNPKIVVVAKDTGVPSLSSTATVLVTISDVNDNEPMFDQTYYNITVSEDERVGHCILNVSASDPDCGINAVVNFTIGGSAHSAYSKYFQVNPTTGQMCISSKLDHEVRSAFEIPMVATDRGGLSTTAMVKVHIVDVNDNRPIFYPREYNVSLPELYEAVQTPVVAVVATDPDSGVFGRVRYKIMSGNERGLFRIDGSTGEIFVVGRLRRDSSVHHLVVSAQDGTGYTSEQNAHVYISILSSRQQPPVFELPRYLFKVPEDAARRTVIGTVSARSADRSIHSIRYTISSGDPEGYFSIDPLMGSIMVEKPLDHEKHSSLLLNVQAASGEPPSYGHTQVNISVFDINDNTPMFESPVVKISIPENADLKTSIYEARATDPDSGRNGQITYSLLENPEDAFKINPRTGIVMLKRSLDYEVRQQYRVILSATDGGSVPLHSNMTIVLEVQDINDNAPIFQYTEYKTNILESLPANSQFLQVAATDADTGNNARLTFRIKDTTQKFGVFPNNGFLYLKEAIDREEASSYSILVEVVDNGSPSLSSVTTVTVNILDANDNDPTFLQDEYEFSLPENRERGYHVGNLTAIDRDQGDNAVLRYYLSVSEEHFKINSETGEILTNMALDREQKPYYEFVAEVRDKGVISRSSRVSVRVIIVDVNDNAPVFVDISGSQVSVREEQPVGTEVVQLQASDADAGENAEITYEIIPGQESSDGSTYFAIHSTSGVITTRSVLDHEQQDHYTLTVVARDLGEPSLESQMRIRIHVLDLNDNQPTFFTSSLTFQIREGFPLGKEVGIVQAIDRDEGDNGDVAYSIASGNLYNVFDIGKSSGSLYTIREVDYELAAEYTLQIKAVDKSEINPRSSFINVKIKIEDVNDCPPKFPEDPVIFSIPESATPGRVLVSLNASDKDSGVNGQLRYAIVEQMPYKAFQIDPLSGSLILVERLDYEQHNEFIVIVKATDQAKDPEKQLFALVTCDILVEDENDNAPVFKSKASIDIREDEPVGFVVLNALAFDADSRDNGRVSYTIESGNEKSYFELDSDTGALQISKTLDREEAAFIQLNLTATDHGRPPRTSFQSVRVNIQDVNDCSPKFTQERYSANVSESAPIGTIVAVVQATDRDIADFGNLTYFLPEGTSLFTIDSRSRTIRTNALLDREAQAVHELIVYVADTAQPAHIDAAVVVIDVTDVNDHTPDFGQSCYPLHVPENSDFSVIHTVAATDRDAGRNAEVTYAITDGNSGNKFSIDLHTGALSCRPLDRDTVPVYRMSVVAQDRGSPPKMSTCNITVYVLDRNDNDPQFEHSEYSARVSEDAPLNTTVLVVRAQDIDEGLNGKVTYSLGNATASLFNIDSETGVITTAGMFDRERKASYIFEVRASDSGRYDARFHTATVYVTVLDVNDNPPIFIKFPFTETVSPDARKVGKVVAKDLDEGPNGNVVYSFANKTTSLGPFFIDSETGQVTATGLHSYVGQTLHIPIVAEDRGNNPLQSSGVLEVRVGENSRSEPSLRFQQDKYEITINEHSARGTDLVQVRATDRYTSTRDIRYGFGSLEVDGAFTINPETGSIRINNPRRLDFEEQAVINRTIIASRYREGMTTMFGYAVFRVNLKDENDNPPIFSQSQYVASVWEGNNKGTFVTQVSALDRDQGDNGRVVYHIIEGNHDNAFAIDPPFSGIIKTNIVLDREIRDTYKLTIIATDEGSPQLTGTCALQITIVDVNDNQPVFPPYNVVSVSEAADIGSVIMTITANDVDTNPVLTYSFTNNGNPDTMFSIDRYSGKITLAKPLDREKKDKYQLQIQVSDSAHIAETFVTVHVDDANDNRPLFESNFYTGVVTHMEDRRTHVLQVTAKDLDLNENGRISYTLKKGSPAGFYVDGNTGDMYLNSSSVINPGIVQLTVIASDHGQPSLSSSVPVRVEIQDIRTPPPAFINKFYKTKISEVTPIGSTILELSAADQNAEPLSIDYVILSGNTEDAFIISSTSGEVIVAKRLDREVTATYALLVAAVGHSRPGVNSTAQVIIELADVNDTPPKFNQSQYEASLSEAAAIGTTVMQVKADDLDESSSRVTYEITSGNEMENFHLDSKSGEIVLRKSLDYDEVAEYRFIVRASDNGENISLSSLVGVTIKIKDENDNAPKFPLMMYTEFVEESSQIGTTVFTACATDEDRGAFGKLNYTLTEGDGKDRFHIDPHSGVVTTNSIFDYESKNRYQFTILAMDAGGKYATVQVQVNILSKDEYPPEFKHKSYHFTVPGNAPAGFVVGRVHATDMDQGADGVVQYFLRNPSSSFKINSTTGAIAVRTPHRSHRNKNLDVSLVVLASTGKPNSLTGSTSVQLTIDFSLNASLASQAEERRNSSFPGWAVFLLVLMTMLVTAVMAFVFVKRIRHRGTDKPMQGRPFDTSFDINIRPTAGQTNLSHYPPHYNEISHYDTADGATRLPSQITSRSASSGRGSVEEGEDVEDEEIRMINEGLHQQGIRDVDTISQVSAKNTQEYLARLGITASSDKLSTQENVYNDYSKISETGGSQKGFPKDDDDLSNIIYEKLDDLVNSVTDDIPPKPPVKDINFLKRVQNADVEPSMAGSLSSIVHSEEELTGSYNWDYLLDWGPQYQPLAHVFAEIARLKDDAVGNYPSCPPPPRSTRSNASSGTSSKRRVAHRMPPPILTTRHPPLPSQQHAYLRSPMGYDSVYDHGGAMCPSFSPALSPLATKSPSMSPVGPMYGPQVLPCSTRTSIRSSRTAPPPTVCSDDSNEMQI